MKKITLLLTVSISLFISGNLNAQFVDILTNVYLPLGLAFDGDDLYFTHDDKVSKIDVTATNPVATTVVTGLSYPDGLVLNGNDLYIAQRNANKISKIDITETNPTLIDIVNSGLNFPSGLALRGNILYIAEGFGHKISKIDITEVNPTVNDVINTQSPYDLTFNGVNLYYTNIDEGKVYKIDVTDNNPTPIEVINGINEPSDIIFIENNLYIGSCTDSKVYKFIADTSTLIEVAANAQCPADMIFKGNDLYIAGYYNNGKIYKYANLLSTNEVELGNTLALCPNPATSFIELTGLEATVNYSIYSTMGKEVAQGIISNNEKINVENLTKGIYFLKLENKKVMKFIKE